MAESNYKVLITTSGIGQRLGELTKYTNKALVRVGKKPALSYVIEAYPKEIPLVITLGHFGQHVKDFIKLAYPDRSIEFVEVDKYDGEGASLGYSMLRAKNNLQCPFIYHAHDTLILRQTIPRPDKNWIGGTKGHDTSQYASWKTRDGKVISYAEKGALDFDYLHIGLIGIKDYFAFWQILEELYRQNPGDQSLGEGMVVTKMLDETREFRIHEFPRWLDVGNTGSLYLARREIADRMDNLDKVDESIYFFDEKFVLKFFADQNIVKNRVARAKMLTGLVPEILESTPNLYKYKYIPGELYSETVTPEDFGKFLQWARAQLWKKNETVSKDEFEKKCRTFYKDKTIERIQKFLKKNSLADQEHIINGQTIPTLEKLLQSVDWQWLCASEQYKIHGDFVLDNIIKTKTGFVLLDWRQDFGGLLESGDIYYDFAKLNHNLSVNHGIVLKNLFQIKIDSNKVTCDIMRKQVLVECQKILTDFLQQDGFDLKKTNVLSALVWLNMAPLHHHPFNLFLHYFGKYNLWKALNQKN